jgi:hypothetical protein
MGVMPNVRDARGEDGFAGERVGLQLRLARAGCSRAELMRGEAGPSPSSLVGGSPALSDTSPCSSPSEAPLPKPKLNLIASEIPPKIDFLAEGSGRAPIPPDGLETCRAGVWLVAELVEFAGDGCAFGFELKAEAGEEKVIVVVVMLVVVR